MARDTIPTDDRLFCDILSRLSGKGPKHCEEVVRYHGWEGLLGTQPSLSERYGAVEVEKAENFVRVIKAPISAVSASFIGKPFWVYQETYGGIPEQPTIFNLEESARGAMEQYAKRNGGTAEFDDDGGGFVDGEDGEARLWKYSGA